MAMFHCDQDGLGMTLSWRAAAGLSLTAVYAPFILMATYTLLFVPCAHCKKAAWMLLPWAPGLVPLELSRQALNLEQMPEALTFALSFSVSVALVLGLAWLAQRGRRVCLIALGVAFILASVCAWGILHMIRA
jgi:hypothetical protein